MDETILFGENEKELETLIQTVTIYSNDIRMEYGKKICHVHKEKWKATNDVRNRTIKSKKKIREIETYKYLGIFEAVSIKQAQM